VGKFRAAGIVSYAQNQKTRGGARTKNLIRWGIWRRFSPNKTLGYGVAEDGARISRAAGEGEKSCFTRS